MSGFSLTVCERCKENRPISQVSRLCDRCNAAFIRQISQSIDRRAICPTCYGSKEVLSATCERCSRPPEAPNIPGFRWVQNALDGNTYSSIQRTNKYSMDEVVKATKALLEIKEQTPAVQPDLTDRPIEFED